MIGLHNLIGGNETVLVSTQLFVDANEILTWTDNTDVKAFTKNLTLNAAPVDNTENNIRAYAIDKIDTRKLGLVPSNSWLGTHSILNFYS